MLPNTNSDLLKKFDVTTSTYRAFQSIISLKKLFCRWENHAFTGHNSPLYARPDELDETSPGFNFNTDFSVKYWLQKGAKKSQLLLGLGTYGRGFRLENPSENGLYAPATGGIDAGYYTSTAGFWGYNEYCEKMLTEQSQWTIVRVRTS